MDTAEYERGRVMRTPWVYYVMLLIVTIVLFTVLAAYASSREDKFVPWKVGVFDLENNDILRDNIKAYTDLAWSGTLKNATIDTRITKLGGDMNFPDSLSGHGLYAQLGAQPPFLACVRISSLALVDVLKKDDTTSEEGTKDLQKAMWDCARHFNVPRVIKKVATADLLLFLLMWCAHAACSRGFAVYTTLRVDGVKSMTVFVVALGTFLAASGVAIYAIIEASKHRADLAIGIITLTCMSLGGLAASGVAALKGKAMHVNELYKKADGMRFNPTWVILSLVKPLVVAPLFAMMVLVLTGVVELFSLLVVFFVSICLSLMSSVLAYYNLVDTSYKMQGYPSGSFLRKLDRHPVNTVLICIVMICTISFLPWPRRSDDQSLWDAVFGSFVLFAGLVTMVMPDIVWQYGAANAIRELSETIIRLVVTAGLLYGVW
eukprot:3514832-Rhodomonas_salina.4